MHSNESACRKSGRLGLEQVSYHPHESTLKKIVHAISEEFFQYSPLQFMLHGISLLKKPSSLPPCCTIDPTTTSTTQRPNVASMPVTTQGNITTITKDLSNLIEFHKEYTEIIFWMI